MSHFVARLLQQSNTQLVVRAPFQTNVGRANRSEGVDYEMAPGTVLCRFGMKRIALSVHRSL